MKPARERMFDPFESFVFFFCGRAIVGGYLRDFMLKVATRMILYKTQGLLFRILDSEKKKKKYWYS